MAEKKYAVQLSVSVYYLGELRPAYTTFYVTEDIIPQIESRKGWLVDRPIIDSKPVEEVIEPVEEVIEPVNDVVEEDSIDYSKLTIKQLKDIAEERGIDISKVTKKNDIIELLI